jgi:hypothetical protein
MFLFKNQVIPKEIKTECVDYKYRGSKQGFHDTVLGEKWILLANIMTMS